MAIADIDASAIDFDRADENCARPYLVGIQVRIGLHTIERFQRHAIRMTCANQEVAEVSRSVRVGQISARGCADVADKWSQASKRAGNGVWLKEENRMLAGIWWQGRNLACSLRKIMSIGGIYRQTNLAIVVEND